MKKNFMVAVLATAMFATFNANGQSVGDTFEVDGVTYKVTSLSPNEVQLGKGGFLNVAFATNPTGSYTILSSVTGGTGDLTYSVTSIGESAFYDCSGLTSVTIPNSVTSIGRGAFYDCIGLTSITIGNSVTSIVDAAFMRCSGLTSVTIPNSVTSIGYSAFERCSGLTSITIGNSVTSIGERAFELTAWYNNQPDGVVYINTCLYNYKGTMPANTSITIQAGTTLICDAAFDGCSGLTSVTIPNSVTSIGDDAFYGCSGLTSINVSGTNFKLATNVGSAQVLIPYADAGLNDACGNVVACLAIGNLTIPNSVTSIGESAFYVCSGLTSVTIGNSVTSIGRRAFYDCSGLTSVTIGNSVTSIGDDAFANSGLTEITSLAVTPPTLGNYCFNNVPTPTTIPVHVPCESEAAYQSASGWSFFTNYTNCIATGGLNDVAATPNINLYPNPAKDVINIEGERIIGVEVVDLSGKVVYLGNKTTIDVSAFATGNYFVRVQTANGTVTKKVIVE